MNLKEAQEIIKNWGKDGHAYSPTDRAYGFLEGREAGIKECADIANKQADKYGSKIYEEILSLLEQKP